MQGQQATDDPCAQYTAQIDAALRQGQAFGEADLAAFIAASRAGRGCYGDTNDPVVMRLYEQETWALRQSQRADEGIAHVTEFLARFSDKPDSLRFANMYWHLGYFYNSQDSFAAMLEAYRQAARYAAVLPPREQVSLNLDRAFAHKQMGEYAEATTLYHTLEARLKDIGDTTSGVLARLLFDRAAMQVDRRADGLLLNDSLLRPALADLDRAIALYDAAQEQARLGFAYQVKGRALALLGDAETGIAWIDRAIALGADQQNATLEIQSLRRRGWVQMNEARYAEAADDFFAALEAAIEKKNRLQERQAINDLALLYDRQGGGLGTTIMAGTQTRLPWWSWMLSVLLFITGGATTVFVRQWATRQPLTGMAEPPISEGDGAPVRQPPALHVSLDPSPAEAPPPPLQTPVPLFTLRDGELEQTAAHVEVSRAALEAHHLSPNRLFGLRLPDAVPHAGRTALIELQDSSPLQLYLLREDGQLRLVHAPYELLGRGLTLIKTAAEDEADLPKAD